jgi:hypothetical protein
MSLGRRGGQRLLQKTPDPQGLPAATEDFMGELTKHFWSVVKPNSHKESDQAGNWSKIEAAI